jgi:hypothetical protein
VRHQSLLAYAKYRWAKIAIVVVIAAIVAYAFDRSPHGHYGGSALGYTLGTIGALLIVWLTWVGVRKRRYSSTSGTLLGWLSAHVYLGTSLLVIVTLHAGFEIGWNVHTLAYALMVAVIVSGFYGVYAYLRHPRGITDVLGDDTQESLLLKIADLDRQMRALALSLPDAVNRLVLAAAQGTRIGGGFRAQLSGRDRACPTAAAVVGLQAVGKTLRANDARVNQQVYALMVRKQELVNRARRAVKLKARIDVWLYVRMFPMIALIAHSAAVSSACSITGDRR